MTYDPAIEADGAPIVHTLTVRCAPDHAFRIWTERIDTWWPPDHRLTGDRAAKITFEDPPDGRLVEYAPDGAEVEWGRIRRWDPPNRVDFDWTAGGRLKPATEIEVTFTPDGHGHTVVHLIHRGWEHIEPAERAAFKPLNQANWATCLAAYRRGI